MRASSGGSNAAAKTDYEPFRGKSVAIWPDPDAPGTQYRDDVTRHLLAVGAKVQHIDPAAQGLTGKQDFFDWQEARDSTPTEDLTREIREIMLNAPEVVETPAETARGAAPVYETTVSAAVETPFVDIDNGYIEFPLEVFPNSVRTYISESADAVGVDPAFVGVPALVGLAGAIGNTRRLKIKNSWSEPSILWAALVAHSGSGKSPALDLAMKPIEERQKRDHKLWKERHRRWEDVEVPMYESAMKQAKGGSGQQAIEKPEEPIEVRTLVSDITIEAVGEKLQYQLRGLICKRDELAGWLGSFTRYKSSGGSGDEPAWLELHGGRSVRIDRRNAGRSIFVPHGSVSVIGTIQPEILKESVTDQQKASGLAPRLLRVRPPELKRQWTEADVNPETEREYTKTFERLFSLDFAQSEHGEQVPRLMEMTSEAKRLFIQFFNNHNDQRNGMTGEQSAIWSKLEGYCGRFALILHLTRWASGEISDTQRDAVDADSMRAAVKLTNWFANESERILDFSAETPDQKEDRENCNWIKRHGGETSAREISQKWRKFKNKSDQAHTALSRLVKLGLGKWVQVKGPGRPAERFVLCDSSGVYASTLSTKVKNQAEDIPFRRHEEPFVDTDANIDLDCDESDNEFDASVFEVLRD